MELPKNVTRVGQADSRCKIYVEDYVITYLKQLNVLARDKEMVVALYGIRREEEAISYVFIYGAGRVNTLQRETRHLSQAQNQEMEKLRKHHFPEYRLLGYRVLDGEMIDGMHVCEQGICRYVEGYAQFYEKNDAMLAYMLVTRETTVEPEKTDRGKYEAERQRRESRRIEAEVKEKRTSAIKATNFRQIEVAVVVAFVILCMAGMTTLKGSDETGALQVMGDKIMDKLTEDKILEEIEQTQMVEADIMDVTEEAEKEEVTSLVTTEHVETETVVISSVEAAKEEAVVVSSETTSETIAPSEETTMGEAVAASEESNTYIIAQGDNLIAISVRVYGDDSMVDAICELNKIDNPDEVKVGQKILLP